MNPFEEAGDLVAKIITFAVILIVPGTVFVYSIVSGVFLKEVGHEQTSNVVTTAGNVYGETTTVLGMGILQFFIANPLLFIILCFLIVMAKKGGLVNLGR